MKWVDDPANTLDKKYPDSDRGHVTDTRFTESYVQEGRRCEGLALVRGTSPLTRVLLLSVALMSNCLVSAPPAAAATTTCMPSDAFLSSASDARGLVAAAAVALGAQPITDRRPTHSTPPRRRVFVVPALSEAHLDPNFQQVDGSTDRSAPVIDDVSLSKIIQA